MSIEYNKKISNSVEGKALEIGKKWIPWLVFFSITINVATVYMTQPIMGLLSISFNVPMEEISVAVSLVTLMYAFSFILYGSFSDKYGRRRFLLFGSLGLGIVTTCVTFTPNFGSFLLITACQGIIAGSLPAVAIPYMADITPRERIGQAMGIALSGTVAGTVMGRSVSGVIAQMLGWKMTYVIYSIILILIFILLLRLPKNNRVDKELSVMRTLGNTICLLGNIKILQLLFVGAFLFFAYLGSATFLTPYLSGPPFGYGPGVIGLLGFAGVAGIIISPIAGKFVVKFGSYKVMITGIAIVIASIQFMAYIQSIIIIVIGLVLMYAGVFICQPAVLSLVTTAVGQKQRGGGSSLYLLFCMGGGSIGAFVLRFVYMLYNWIGVVEVSTLVCSLGLLLAIAYAIQYSVGTVDKATETI